MHGSHLAFGDNAPPLCNLYVGMRQRLGISCEKFVSRKGALTGLDAAWRRLDASRLAAQNPPMVLLIDNYDSFTYNLVQRLGEIDPELHLEVRRNDQITLDEISAMQPERIIISPGPCTPSEAGISVDCIRRFAGQIPILGVCLGHQSMGQAFGAKIVRCGRLMHGKTDLIHHDGRGLFAGLPNPFLATRYHSLVIQPDTLSADFEVSAWSDAPDGTREIMGARHKRYPLEGVQFHPESFLTQVGHDILRHFLRMPRPAGV